MIEGTEANFEEAVLKAEGAVLVDFNADWCGPCQMMKPIVEEMAAEGVKVVSVNIDDQGELAEQYEVSTIPCLVVFKDGKEVAREVGVTPKKKLLKLMAE